MAPRASASAALPAVLAGSGCLFAARSFVSPGGGLQIQRGEQARQIRSAAAAEGAVQDPAPSTSAISSAGASSLVGSALAAGSLLAAAAALAPSLRQKAGAQEAKTTVLRRALDASQEFGVQGPLRPLRAFENELGVQAPVGFWDPLGLSKSGDEAAFNRRRAVEIKHGRVSMLATMGYIVPEYFKWPGYLSPSMDLKFEDVPNGLAAFSKLPVQGGAQIVAFAGFIETTGFFSGEAKNIGLQRCATQAGEPGNYGVGFPTFFGKVADPEVRKRKLAAEIANGRLAMMAIIGMFFQDGLTGSAWGDWSLYDASLLR